MTFKRVEKILNNSSPKNGDGVKAMLRKDKGTPARLAITIFGDLMKTLDWRANEGIEMMLGCDDDYGRIRLRKNNSMAVTKVSECKFATGKYLYISLGRQPFVDRVERAIWCQWSMEEDGWLEIVLPRWADETNPRHVVKPVRQVVGGRR